MTSTEYYQYVFFDWLSSISQFTLLICGLVFVFSTWGWFVAGCVLFITAASTTIHMMDQARIMRMQEEYELYHDDPDEDL